MCTKNNLANSNLINSFFRKAIVIAALTTVVAGCNQDPLAAGNGHMKKGDFPAAIIEYKNAVQANPDSIEARLALAEALEHIYDTIGAEHHLRKAANKGVDSDPLMPRIALLMLDRNESAKVIKEFKDLRLKSPEADSNLRAAVAVAYVSQKQPAIAEEQLKEAANNTPAVILAKAQLLLGQNKKDEAIAALDSSLGDQNSPWWVLRALSRIYESNGKREEAFQFMNRAYEAAPWHRGVMGEYGEFLIGAGKLDEAVVIRDRLKKLAPSFYWTNYLDALVLSQQGRPEESQAAALKVLAASPEHLPATLLTASAELRKGDVAMASTRLKKIAPQHPYSVPTLQLLAEAQLRQGKIVDAADAIRRGLSVAPTNQQLLSLKADSEVSRGAVKEATTTLQQLSAANPGNASYLLRLSELQTRLGNKEAANKYLDQATEAGKDIPAIRSRILGIALSMGDIARVTQLADYAIKSHPQDPQSQLTLAAAKGVQNDKAGAWLATLAALDLQPAYQPALNGLAMLAKEPSQREELLARHEKAVQEKSASDSAYLGYARLLLEAKNDRTKVIALLEKGVAALPSSTPLREALAEEYFRIGKPDSAINLTQVGASANNAHPEAGALLAATYERVGNTKLATETYRKLATNFPQRTDWRLKLAELEAKANQKKEATTILRALMSDRPFDPAAYITLAKLTSPNDLREALSIAKELGDRDQNKLTAMLLEGDLLAQAGQLDNAIVQYSKAAKAGALPTAMIRTVQTLDQANRTQAADQELADTLRKFPDDPQVIGFAAQRVRSRGNLVKATEMLQKIADKNPLNPFVLNDLAWIQIEAKQADALKNATKAAELAPNNPQILDTLAIAQAQAGKQSEAIANLRTAVNLAPTAQAPKLHLAELLLASGDKKGATSLIQPIDPNQLSSKDQEALKQLKSSLAG